MDVYENAACNDKTRLDIFDYAKIMPYWGAAVLCHGLGLEWFFGGKALLKFFRVANFSGVEGMAAFNKVVTEFRGYILNDKAAACPMEVLQSSGRNLSGLFQEIKPSSGEEACGGGKAFSVG